MNRKNMALNKLKDKISGPLSALVSNVSSLLEYVFDRIPEEKRRPVLFGLAGLIALVLILIITVGVLNSGRSGRSGRSGIQETAAGPNIPVEDLFMPAEPDFVPQFLLEREPRHFWTIDDIRPYWRNPGTPELWREEIMSAVDRLMEGVP